MCYCVFPPTVTHNSQDSGLRITCTSLHRRSKRPNLLHYAPRMHRTRLSLRNWSIRTSTMTPFASVMTVCLGPSMVSASAELVVFMCGNLFLTTLLTILNAICIRLNGLRSMRRGDRHCSYCTPSLGSWNLLSTSKLGSYCYTLPCVSDSCTSV